MHGPTNVSSLKPTSRKQFVKLAYDLTKDSKVPRRFNTEISLQGSFCQFMSRHLQLCLRNITHKFNESIRAQQMSAAINPFQNSNK